MALNTTGRDGAEGNIRPGVDTLYNRALLSRALPNLPHGKFADKKPFKLKSGKKQKFRRWLSLPVEEVPVPLVEGVAPTSQTLQYEEFDVQLYHYGKVVAITDEIDMTVEDPVLTETAMLLGEQAGLTVDRIYREVMNGSSAFYRIGTDIDGGRETVAGKINSTALEIALRTLRRNNAKKFTKGISASTGVGTLPVRPAYWAICHPDLITDLEGLADFIHVSKYASQTGIDPDEVGCWKDIRIICSTNARIWPSSGALKGATGLISTDTTNIDVYSLLILGQNAYGTCPLGSDNARNIRKGFSEGGPSNPLEQIATSGWSVWTCAVILDPKALYRIECGVTA